MVLHVFYSISSIVVFLSIIPATILIAAATMNKYTPIPKPQVRVAVPAESMVWVVVPPKGADEIAVTMSVTSMGNPWPPEKAPATDSINTVKEITATIMRIAGISEVMPLIM